MPCKGPAPVLARLRNPIGQYRAVGHGGPTLLRENLRFVCEDIVASHGGVDAPKPEAVQLPVRVGLGIGGSAQDEAAGVDHALVGNTTYAYAVRAFDLAGNVSAPSTPANVTTLADTTPRGPGNFCWANVTLSPAKLRKNFDAIELQMNNGNGEHHGRGNRDFSGQRSQYGTRITVD